MDDPLMGVPPSAIDPGIHGLVRESVQNCFDQRNQGARVTIEFELLELNGHELDSFLEAVGWTQLRVHLSGIAEGDSHQKALVASALQALEQRKMRLLVIRDFDTKGLDGPETSSPGVKPGNFTKLCRDGMVPTAGVGGGSFGIGKSVYWNHSRVRSVVMSSRYMEGTEIRSRVFGRAYLPDHYLMNEGGFQQYSGHGYWCKFDDDGRTHSMTFEEAGVSEKSPLSMLWREPSLVGTTIVSMMFDSGEESEQSLEELAVELKDAVNVNFWPLLRDDLVDVHIRFPGGEYILDDYDQVFEPYVRAAEAPTHEPQGGTLKPNGDDACSQPVSLRVPKRRVEDVHEALIGETQFGVTILSDDERGELEQLELRYRRLVPGFRLVNTAAHVRGPRMVVKYENTGARDFPYVAVLRAGKYRSVDNEITNEDMLVEQFIRDSEPPAHDKWGWPEKIRENYQPGWGVAFKEFMQEQRSILNSLLKKVLEGGSGVPEGLARKLRGGTGIGDRVRSTTFKLSEFQCSFDLSEDPGVVEASFLISRVQGEGASRDWQSVVALEVVGEQGNSRIPIWLAEVEGSPDLRISPIGSGPEITEYLVECPAAVSSFRVNLTGGLGSFSPVIRHRLRVDGLHRTQQVESQEKAAELVGAEQ